MELEHKMLAFKDGYGDFTFKVKLTDNLEYRKKEGYLICRNVIMGRTGYYKYHLSDIQSTTGFGGNNIVYIKRKPEEVFHPDSLASIEGIPVTFQHPEVGVTSKNFRETAVGYVLGKPRRDGNNIVGDILLFDEYVIDKVLSKEMRELSLGYDGDVEKDENGELIQKNIRVNHLAIVKRGRAGNALILDHKTKGVDIVENKEKKFNITLNLNEFKDSKSEEIKEKDEKKEEKKVVEKEVEIKDEKTTQEKKEVKDEKPTKEEKAEETKDNKKEEKESKEDKKGEKKLNFNDVMKELQEIEKLPKTEFRDNAMNALNEKAIAAGLGSILPNEEDVASITKENPFKDTHPVHNLGIENPEVNVSPDYTAVQDKLNRFYDSMSRAVLDREFDSSHEQRREILKRSSFRAKDIINGVDIK